MHNSITNTLYIASVMSDTGNYTRLLYSDTCMHVYVVYHMYGIHANNVFIITGKYSS